MSTFETLHSHSNPWGERHSRACELKRLTYVDPETGYQVFTEYGLKERGSCCGSACRHCPYDHENVPQHFKAG